MQNVRIFDSLNAVYQQVLRDVLENPQYTCSPRGLTVKEILGYLFEVRKPTLDPITTADADRNLVIAAYTRAEFELYNSLTRDAEEYAHAAAFWKQIQNPDGTINSAYGYLIWGRKCCGDPHMELHGKIGEGTIGQQEYHSQAPWCMRTPWDWAMETLRRDKDSRQAIMHFNTPDVLWYGNKDVVCTLFVQFFIREDELHMFVDMRSNDVVRGLVYDCVWFSSILHKALDELRITYPNLQLGNYRHYAHSMHIYEPQFAMAGKMLDCYA